MGSTRPSIAYNSVTNRWEIKGKGGVLKLALDDGSSGVPLKMFSFVGSSPAIGSIGDQLGLVATISGGKDLLVGDKVFCNPRPPLLAAGRMAFSHFQVPSNAILSFSVHCIGTAGGSLSAMGWDVFAIRT